MPNIFALLVGINAYPSKPLSGCINDVDAVKKFLEKTYGNDKKNELSIKTLTDNDKQLPTRENLISAFDFFDKAGAGDYCFFYYSGHGSFVKAPDEFETDNGFMQSIVCIDSRDFGGKDLMDKELGFLLARTMHKKKDKNFIAITDCCHSGTIMRAIDDSGITDRLVSGRAENVPQEPKDYLGFDEKLGDRKAYYKNSRGKLEVVEAPHIHIAASRDSQTSKELDIDGVRRGAFTHSLLKVLHTMGGRISYKELVHQTAALVKNLVPEQEPDINLNGGLKEDAKDKYFLSSENAVANPLYLVSYEPEYSSWCLQGGTMHGISEGDQIKIDNKGDMIETEVTASPRPDISLVRSVKDFGSESKTYYAKVIRQPNQGLKVSFAADIPDAIKKYLIEADKEKPSPFVTLLQKGTGSYIIHAEGDKLVYISTAGDDKAVFEAVPVTNTASAEYFIEQIAIVSKWKNLMEFNNPASTLSDKDYTINLYRTAKAGSYQIDSLKEIEKIESITDLVYQQINSKWAQPAFRLTITNHGSVPLWVTNVYLGFDYRISTEYFSTIEVGPGLEVPLSFKTKSGTSEEVIKMMVDKKFLELGYTEITEYIKLFISTVKISTDHLKQDGVNLPVKKSIERSFDERPAFVLKTPGDEEDENGTKQEKWKTETIGFRIIRPQEKSELRPGAALKLGSVQIIAHDHLSAKASIFSSASYTRSVEDIAPPHEAYNNSFLAPYDLVPGTRTSGIVDVLELSDISDPSVVTEEKPLIIELPASRSANEGDIIAVGYDKTTELYYPLGYTNEKGQIVINHLPQEPPSDAPDAAITQKSFFGSIKIYFQKIIGKKLPFFKYDYPRLAVVTVNDALEVEYENDKEKVKDQIKQANKIFLFIHGIIGDTESMVKCIKTQLNDKGKTLCDGADLMLSFDYENLNTKIEDNAALLKARLEEMDLKDGDGKKITIIAHSMGGLISRWYIEKLDGRKIIDRLVMLGTPNNGSPWADVRDMAETLLTYAINGAAFLKPWTLLLSLAGKLVKGAQVALKQMDPDTGIYPQLNDGTDPLTKYILIAGNTKSIIVKYEETASLIKRLFTRVKKRGVYDALDVVLFKEPNDIAAKVKSVQIIKGSEKWKIPPDMHEVACDHMNYFLTLGALEKI